MASINGKGRAQLYSFELNKGVYILIYNVYGWPNAATCKEARARSSDLLDTILEDMHLQPPGPMLILGDFNGNLHNFSGISTELAQGGLVDVGAQAARYGTTPADYTCTAHHAATPTRRDYLLANPIAYDLITHFDVHHSSSLPVHDVLRFCLPT